MCGNRLGTLRGEGRAHVQGRGGVQMGGHKRVDCVILQFDLAGLHVAVPVVVMVTLLGAPNYPNCAGHRIVLHIPFQT